MTNIPPPTPGNIVTTTTRPGAYEIIRTQGKYAGLNYLPGDARRVPHPGGDDDRTTICAVTIDTLTVIGGVAAGAR